MALLPLPFNETVETVGQVNNLNSALPEPELYIILNGKPTKQQHVWHSLVNVEAEIQNKTNWLYMNVEDKLVDEAANQLVEITNNTSSTMLEKASTDGIAAFQAYTIRSSSGSDIDQSNF